MEKKIFDLKERTYNYALDVIQFLESLPKNYISQTLGRQLLRSATSIGANIIEAQASSSKKDFVNFYHHSLKSANESKFWFGLLKGHGQWSFRAGCSAPKGNSRACQYLSLKHFDNEGEEEILNFNLEFVTFLRPFSATLCNAGGCHPRPVSFPRKRESRTG